MRRAVLIALLAIALASCTGHAPNSPGAAVAPSHTTTTTARTAPPASPSAAPRAGGAALASPPPTGAALLEPELPHTDRMALARRLKGIDTSAIPLPTNDPLPPIGTEQDFWVVQSDPPRTFQVSAALRTVSDHAEFWVQDGAGVSDADMTRAANDFESKVYPTVTRMFGTPVFPAGDPNPRITILHLKLPGVGGYFTDVDQLPPAIARISNARRMIYIDLRAGPPGTASYPGLVAHEFQHLIHHDRHPYADAWINEGLSELANEAVSGAGSFLRNYDTAPDTQVDDWDVNGANAPHYGAAHSFLRYLLNHYGGLDRAKDLVVQQGRGVNAVQAYLRGFNTTFEDVFADWLAANYAQEPGDGRFSNGGADTQVRQITHISAAGQGSGDVHQFGADYVDFDLQGNAGDFHFQGATTVPQVPNTPASGQGEWWSNRGDSLDATLTREIDLRQVPRAALRFKTWYDIERGYDYAYVEASTDNGASWAILRGRAASDFDPVGQAFGPGYTGRSGNGDDPSWVDEQIDLTPYAGKRILLRFEYITDEAANAAGFAIDDIAIPEIGFVDDAERDSGWQAAGFVRLTGPLPQRYLIQLVTHGPNGWASQRVDVAADGSANIHLPAGNDRTAVIISGATFGTNLTAPYSWDFRPAGDIGGGIGTPADQGEHR